MKNKFILIFLFLTAFTSCDDSNINSPLPSNNSISPIISEELSNMDNSIIDESSSNNNNSNISDILLQVNGINYTDNMVLQNNVIYTLFYKAVYKNENSIEEEKLQIIFDENNFTFRFKTSDKFKSNSYYSRNPFKTNNIGLHSIKISIGDNYIKEFYFNVVDTTIESKLVHFVNENNYGFEGTKIIKNYDELSAFKEENLKAHNIFVNKLSLDFFENNFLLLTSAFKTIEAPVNYMFTYLENNKLIVYLYDTNCTETVNFAYINPNYYVISIPKEYCELEIEIYKAIGFKVF